ncbi:MAG: LysR family transcriptional regulator, partial [Sciscionella sp.]
AELFHRLPRGVRLTSAGDALVAHARRVLRDLESGRASVREVAGLVAGRLDLASLPTLTLDPLAAVLGRFRHRYREVSVRLLQPEQRSSVLDAVRGGEAELGFADAQPGGDRELESVHIGWQELVVTMPPGTKRPRGGSLTVDRLLSLELITGQQGTLARDLLGGQARRRGREFNLVVEVAHRESALHLVVAGAGCALLPEPLARIAALEGAVLASVSPPVRRELHLLRRPGPLSPAARAFQSLLLRGREEP